MISSRGHQRLRNGENAAGLSFVPSFATAYLERRASSAICIKRSLYIHLIICAIYLIGRDDLGTRHALLHLQFVRNGAPSRRALRYTLVFALEQGSNLFTASTISYKSPCYRRWRPSMGMPASRSSAAVILVAMPPVPCAEPAPPAIRRIFASILPTWLISLACGLVRGLESYRPSISKITSRSALAHTCHDCGQRIVIHPKFSDVLQLGGCNRVVFVDDGHNADLGQRGKRVMDVGALVVIDDILARQRICVPR